MPDRSTPITLDVDKPPMDGFTIHKLLGAGGFARVWVATRNHDEARVAIKVGRTTSVDIAARFAQEARSLKAIGPPHVPKLLSSGCLQDGLPFLVMEYLRGRTLASLLASLSSPPQIPSILKLADRLLVALEAVHRKGIVHRDFKPENIFITREGRIVLLDLGLAKVADHPHLTSASRVDACLTRTGMTLGTIDYMAPEQIGNRSPVDSRADIYAFGVVLFEMLTLRPPFVGSRYAIEYAHIALRPPRPSQLIAVPEALDQLVLACMSKDPDKRPPNVSSIRDTLMESRTSTLVRPRSNASLSTTSSSLSSSSQSARRLTDGRQLVVVLMLETNGAPMFVISAVSECNGWIARHHGRRYICVFSGKDTDDPGLAALAAARQVLAHARGRAALLLGSVVVRHQPDGSPPTIYDAIVDRPDTWLPPEPWSGILVSDRLAQALPPPQLAMDTTQTSPPHPFVPALVDDVAPDILSAAQPPLFGRQNVIEALEQSAKAAFDGTCPALITLLGDVGSGKSRLATEAASIAQSTRPDALIVSISAAQRVYRSPEQDIANLIQQLQDGHITSVSTAPASSQSPVRDLAEQLRNRAQQGPVAVIVDDAHWVDDALMDALELATLEGKDRRLWVVVIAAAQFAKFRPMWGKRTQRHQTIELSPLDEEAASKLAAALLLPAEYPPAQVLKRLAQWTAGNPACLTQLVQTLKQSGIVHRRDHTGTYYVATAELDKLPPSAAWQWLAARQLDALPSELSSCLLLCAVLGTSFTHKELDEIQDSIDRTGSAGTPVDAAYGLNALVEQDILVCVGKRYCFKNSVFQQAIYETLDPEQRKEIHQHAFRVLRSSTHQLPHEDMEQMARHAATCGEHQQATQIFLSLGGAAALKHRYLEADKHYTAALASANDNLWPRVLALKERGQCRYLLHRPQEAVDDLASARHLVQQIGDSAFLADILLEEATALDWADDWDASAQRVEQAQVLIEQHNLKKLEVRLLVAQGRTFFRRGQIQPAIDHLERGGLLAKYRGDKRTYLVALVMLAPALAMIGRVDQAEIWFNEAIHLAIEVQDWPHLCAAYLNRIPLLWAMKKSLSLDDSDAELVEDLQKIIALSQQIGNPWLERAATYNVAELLYILDHWEEASAIARRAHVLEQRFIERPVPTCSLLLARILSATEDYEEAHALLAWIHQFCPPTQDEPSAWCFFHALRLIVTQHEMKPLELGDTVPTWNDVMVHASSRLLPVEILELLRWRAQMAIEAAHWEEASKALHQADALSKKCPIWKGRFDDLATQVNTAR